MCHVGIFQDLLLLLLFLNKDIDFCVVYCLLSIHLNIHTAYMLGPPLTVRHLYLQFPYKL